MCPRSATRRNCLACDAVALRAVLTISIMHWTILHTCGHPLQNVNPALAPHDVAHAQDWAQVHMKPEPTFCEPPNID